MARRLAVCVWRSSSEDLTAALEHDEAAIRGFAMITPSAKKATLFAVKTAKKPRTRARRSPRPWPERLSWGLHRAMERPAQ